MARAIRLPQAPSAISSLRYSSADEADHNELREPPRSSFSSRLRHSGHHRSQAQARARAAHHRERTTETYHLWIGEIELRNVNVTVTRTRLAAAVRAPSAAPAAAASDRSIHGGSEDSSCTCGGASSARSPAPSRDETRGLVGRLRGWWTPQLTPFSPRGVANRTFAAAASVKRSAHHYKLGDFSRAAAHRVFNSVVNNMMALDRYRLNHLYGPGQRLLNQVLLNLKKLPWPSADLPWPSADLPRPSADLP